jgi:pseudaminic acid synthase
LGKNIFHIDQSEIKNRRFKRSIYVSKNVKKGEIINKNNIKIIRPNFGLEPNNYEKILGKRFKKKIQFGTALKFKMIF